MIGSLRLTDDFCISSYIYIYIYMIWLKIEIKKNLSYLNFFIVRIYIMIYIYFEKVEKREIDSVNTVV